MELTEYPNVDRLRDVLMSQSINKDTAAALYKYYDKVKNTGKITVKYFHPKYNGKSYGRFYPSVKMGNCTDFWGCARTHIYGESETDIDIVNSWASVLLNICKEHKIEASCLEGYVESRTPYINDLRITDADVKNYNSLEADCKTKADLGKRVFNLLSFGACVSSIQDTLHLAKSPFKSSGIAKELKTELESHMNLIPKIEKYSELVADVTAQKKKDKKKAWNGSLFSIIVFNQEQEYVQRAMRAFQDAGFVVTTYVYDGFQIRSTDRERIQSVLNSLNSELPVKFIMKPFPPSIMSFL